MKAVLYRKILMHYIICQISHTSGSNDLSFLDDHKSVSQTLGELQILFNNTDRYPCLIGYFL